MSSISTTSSKNDDALLSKALFAGCQKYFQGPASNKISKTEIQKLVLSELINAICNHVDSFSIRLLSTYCLGASRIYEKAVTYLEEDLVKFNDELSDVLNGTNSFSSKPKKGQTSNFKRGGKKATITEIDAEIPELPELMKGSEIISLFEANRKTDQNLLKEIDIPGPPEVGLGQFGDEIELPEAVSSTPKRKSHLDHDETPKKRQKSLEFRSSTSRRLFDSEQRSSSIPQVRIDPVDENGPESFVEYMPRQNISEDHGQSPLRQIDTENNNKSMPVNPDTTENAPILSQPLLPVIDDNIELEELNDESLTSLTSRRGKRSKIWRDEKKQIKLAIETSNIHEISNLYTRKEGSTLINIGKQSVVNLLSLPAVRLHQIGPCFYGKTLLDLYVKMARPILQTNNEKTFSHSSTLRGISVNKSPRTSTFRHGKPNEPLNLENENVTSEGDIPISEEDLDKELMPPPSIHKSGRENIQGLPPLPTLDQQYSPRQVPRTPTRPTIGPDTPGASPKQLPSALNHLTPIEINIPGNYEAEFPVEEAQIINDNSERRTSIERSPSISSSTVWEREGSLLMDEDEFYSYLQNIWEEYFYKVELFDIILPKTIAALIKYFIFLQRFQTKGKLIMSQDIIYGPVYIEKDVEE